MFKLLTAVAMLAALTVSAQAEVVKGFTVTYDADVFNGACFGEAYYPASKITLMFATAYRDNATVWGLMLINKSWTTKDMYYDVVITAGPEKIHPTGKP